MLTEKIKTIAGERPRFGYRRICALVNAGCEVVNHKRFYRIYRQLNLAVRKRGRRKYFWGRKTPKEQPLVPNVRWSMDFTSDTLSHGRKFRTQNIIDDCTRECLNQYWFSSLGDANEIIARWKTDYNENRPHSSLGNLTPMQFRQKAELKIQNQERKLRPIGNTNLAAVS